MEPAFFENWPQIDGSLMLGACRWQGDVKEMEQVAAADEQGRVVARKDEKLGRQLPDPVTNKTLCESKGAAGRLGSLSAR